MFIYLSHCLTLGPPPHTYLTQCPYKDHSSYTSLRMSSNMEMTFGGFLKQACLTCKTTYLYKTITFEWYVIRCGFVNKHQKGICLKDIGLNIQ